ncbi:hypothetical protein [Symbiobacterium terraclitae]|uniref:hypothetical protein n=1 Tax=Symbiobacterium terraclitae TaxID=557451 RepID=UPI0035B5400A
MNTPHEFRFPVSRVVVIDCYAGDPDALVAWVNAPPPGTSFELIDLDRTSSGDPAGGHLVVLRDELPAWEAAARAQGVRLVPTEAPVRIGEWPGDAVVRPDPPDHLIITIPN